MGILKVICGFSGAYEGLRTSLRLIEEDETRLSSLQHLEEPLRDCKLTWNFWQRGWKAAAFWGQYRVGSSWDTELKRRLKILQDAKKLFGIALDADQHTILSAVERHVRNVAEDVRDLAAHINENGKHLLDLDGYSREQCEKTEAAILVVNENVLVHDVVATKRHMYTESSLHRIEHGVTDHRDGWRDEVKQKQQRQEIFDFYQPAVFTKSALKFRPDDLFRWLSSTDPTVNQNAAWESHEPQTGKRFTCGKQYSHRKETHQSFLWMHGTAGRGKTVLFLSENPSIPTWEFNSGLIVPCTSGSESLFHNACCLSLDHTVQQLLESGKIVHVQSRDLCSTLLAIVWKEHESIVDGLLKPGAGVNISSGYYGTALQIAASRGHETIVNRLLRAGADVNMLSKCYSAALHTAAFYGDETNIDILLMAGADVNISFECYGTALTAALAKGHETIVDRLLRAGADVNIWPMYHGTMLQRAANTAPSAVVDRLLKAGADVTVSPE
ncbi:hypothetical protein MMC29_007843 [Sticta canariensis]|nr:hypothetical protein [Sticta canariensis]